jgi:hypothetical protein
MGHSSKRLVSDSERALYTLNFNIQGGYLPLIKNSAGILANGKFSKLLENDGEVFKTAVDTLNPQILDALLKGLDTKAFWAVVNNDCSLLNYLIRKTVEGKLEADVAAKFMATVISVDPKDINQELESRISGSDEAVRTTLQTIHADAKAMATGSSVIKAS